MAFTVSAIVSNTVFGDLRVKIFNVTPDASTGVFDTGMPRLVIAQASIKSMASFVNSGSTRNVAVISPNSGPAGTALAGQIGMTGCVSGDVYTIICYGKA